MKIDKDEARYNDGDTEFSALAFLLLSFFRSFFFFCYVHYTKNDGKVGDIRIDSLFTSVVIGTRVAVFLTASQYIPNRARGRILRHCHITSQINTRSHDVSIAVEDCF